MIISTPQAKAAILDIKARTDWKDNRIAIKADIHPMVISKLMSGQTQSLTEDSLSKLSTLYDFVLENTEPA